MARGSAWPARANAREEDTQLTQSPWSGAVWGRCGSRACWRSFLVAGGLAPRTDCAVSPAGERLSSGTLPPASPAASESSFGAARSLPHALRIHPSRSSALLRSSQQDHAPRTEAIYPPFLPFHPRSLRSLSALSPLNTHTGSYRVQRKVFSVRERRQGARAHSHPLHDTVQQEHGWPVTDIWSSSRLRAAFCVLGWSGPRLRRNIV